LLRDGHFTVVEDEPPAVLLDVADVVAAHGGGAHVTDERQQLIVCDTGEGEKEK